MTASPPPVVVDALHIGYRTRGRQVHDVVHGVSLEVAAGATVALVGQSGSGKSTIAHAVAGLLPDNGRVTGGRIHLHGEDVTDLDRRGWRRLHGRVIGFVPQVPLSSLDPLVRVGQQIGQALAVHRTVPRADIPARVIRLLDHVGIRDPQQRARSYPHELSGGQLQRVLIAIAIAAEPSVLVADEPTSALDVTVQRRILDLLARLGEELGLATLLITHDLALARERSDRLVVLHHGTVRDSGPSAQVVERPSDPYTVRLLADAPVHQPDRYADLLGAHDPASPVIVSAAGVVKTFGAPGTPGAVRALDGVRFAVRRGSVHALVGESGSGKTTLARVVAGLTAFDAGEVQVGDRVLPWQPPAVNRHAGQVQLVHQNPLAAMDPRYTVARVVEEPLRLHGVLDRQDRRARVGEILDRVALPRTVLDRRARELSGGQRQRVAVARALVLAPEVLVLDEPTSALDVTVQAQIVDLLLEVQRERALTYVFITHDLSLVRQVAHRVSVLDRGRVVEEGDTRQVFDDPEHMYTRGLLEAVPGRELLRSGVRAEAVA